MNYFIRRMQERDAPGVSELFVLTYGTTYDIPDVYSPEKEIELDRSERVYSFVAVDENERVVGHYGITVDSLSRIGEGGEAAVHPDARGQKLLERMRSFAEDFVAQNGLSGLFFEPVTVHTFSQHANEADKAKVCGINLGVSPRGTKYTGIEAQTDSQRVSMVLYFKALAEIPQRRISVPESDAEFLKLILSNIELPYLEFEFGRRDQRGEHLLQDDSVHGFALARVLKSGTDTLQWIRDAKNRFIQDEQGETFYVDLPLSGEDLNGLTETLKKEGFVCIGMVPEFNLEGPVVRYAFLTERYNTGCMQIYSPFARKLLSIILGD